MADCIFCKIIAGEIPSSKVYEDEKVLAFLDISQVTPGHTLVVPKEHFRNVLDMDADSTSQLFARVPDIARKVMKATGAAGMNIINNNEEIAGQTVFHTHVHLVPRYSDADDLKITFAAHEPDFPSLAELAEKIAQAYGGNMKLSNIFLFIGAAAASYKLVENRQKIQEEIIETTDSLDKVKDSLANIQRNIAIIQEQKEQVKDIAQDLTYKYKVLENQAQVQIQQVKDIWEKYES